MRTPEVPIRGRAWLPIITLHIALTLSSVSALDLLVYNNNNSGPGSLRQAVADNNGLGGGNTIVFSNTVTGTITLTSGELLISTNVTILGPGPERLTISGNDASRVFNITGGAVAISGLTVANGHSFSSQGGGVLLTSGTLVLSNGLFDANGAFSSSGGALSSSGNVTIERCAFRNNRASFLGGALNLGGVAFVNNCTIVSNLVAAPIGTAAGGGIFSSGGTNVVIANCTISSNAANGDDYQGGGLSGSASVRNSIIAGNNFLLEPGGVGPDVYGTFTSQGYNLIGISDGSTGWGVVGDQTGTTASPIDPMLSPLGNYGGSTPTMVPHFGSPAIDQGKSFGLTTDQRGRPRPFTNAIPPATLGDHSDIGAVEVGSGINLVVNNSNDNGPGSLRQAVFYASSFEQDSVTFAPDVTNTIILTSGEIELNKNLVIVGPTNRLLTVSGNNSNRVFHATGSNPSIQSLTITRGLAPDYGGGILVDAGNLSLYNCQVVSNAVTTLLGSGGGLFVRSNAVLSILNSSITHNQSSTQGGGVGQSQNAQVSIASSTIASNRTTYGFDGLFASFGGGISVNGGTLSVQSSTIASNVSAYFAGGIGNGYVVAGTADIRNSIVAGNTSVSSGPDVLGPFNSAGYNLISNSSGGTGFTNATDQLNVNPLLGPLGTYGGRTLTMALQWGSPAIDKGKSFGWPGDQRGVVRPLDDLSVTNAVGGDGADIGAFEVDPRLRIVNISRVGNDIGLALTTTLGRTYSVGYASDVDAVLWPGFTNNIPGNGHLVWVTNFGGANQSRRFYRGGPPLD